MEQGRRLRHYAMRHESTPTGGDDWLMVKGTIFFTILLGVVLLGCVAWVY